MFRNLTTRLCEGDRSALAKCITLAESQRAEDRAIVEGILKEILPTKVSSIRIGITGSPGVGKSTFIESFGTYLTSLGNKVAVLTIDPSSPLSKGSILGDKTRMETLSKNPLAFIRPSASQSFPGGVSHATRESILLCEAAGFEIIIVETVGVGQSEFSVKDMTDCFLLLILAGAGDELQGIKKGIMEMADILAITKADGENLKRAQLAAADHQHALHLMSPGKNGWTPKVITTSSLDNKNIVECWDLISKFIDLKKRSGHFMQQRTDQKIAWLKDELNSQWMRKAIQNNAFGKKWIEAIGRMGQDEWTVFECAEFITEEKE